MSEDRSELLKSLSIDRDAAPSRAGGGGARAAVAVIVLMAIGAVAGGAWMLNRGSGPAAEPDAPEIVLAQNDVAPEPASGPASGPASERASERGGEPDANAAPPSRSAAPSSTAPRESGLAASGYVVARRRATVSSEITGRLLEVLVEEGDRVEAGQVLARLDDELARIDQELAEARAASAAAVADALAAELVEAQRALGRAERLASSDFASQSNVDIERARVDGLTARLRGARADADAAAIVARRAAELVDRHLVRAPFSGVIIDKNAQPGEIVSPTSAGGGFTRTGVYTLVDMDSLEIEVDVNEGQIERVRAGQRVEAVLDSYPDWRAPAHVAAIIPTADRNRATIQVRVAFDELDPRILPDMGARVTFLD